MATDDSGKQDRIIERGDRMDLLRFLMAGDTTQALKLLRPSWYLYGEDPADAVDLCEIVCALTRDCPVKNVEQLVQDFPEEWRAHYLVGFYWEWLGRRNYCPVEPVEEYPTHRDGRPSWLHTAVGCYRAALALSPNQVTLRVRLAACLGCLRDFDAATQEYRHALDLDPQSEEAVIGSTYLAYNRLRSFHRVVPLPAERNASMETLVSIPDGTVDQAHIHQELAAITEVARAYTEQHPGCYRVPFVMEFVHRRLGDPSRADAYLGQARKRFRAQCIEQVARGKDCIVR